MSRGQSFSGWFFAQDVSAAVGVQQIRGIGLPPLELFYLKAVTNIRHGLLEPGQEPGFIEFVCWQNSYQLWGYAHFFFCLH